MNFITFEGADGSGKTTQSQLLVKAIKAANLEVVHTREPGGSDSAEIIREMLLSGNIDKWLPMTEMLMMTAARVEHVNRLILPALALGKIVVCDRFIDSTIAYQGFGFGLGIDKVLELHQLSLNNFLPKLTLILNISEELSKERVASRQAKKDRYEMMGDEYNQKVSRAFKEVAKLYPERCELIDGGQDILTIHQAIVEIVNKKLSLNIRALEKFI